jgi:hypothetical protein
VFRSFAFYAFYPTSLKCFTSGIYYAVSGTYPPHQSNNYCLTTLISIKYGKAPLCVFLTKIMINIFCPFEYEPFLKVACFWSVAGTTGTERRTVYFDYLPCLDDPIVNVMYFICGNFKLWLFFL